ncbi:MAG TPA: hypothetical protein VER96_24235 [Polyangiaceae bacterium]|nr:hypothetical protein [Polyangiaceae bacterium]
MTKVARNAFLFATALATGWGCSTENQPVDIGDSYTGEHLQDYSGEWEGYAEAYDFADGSDKVRLELDASGNGTLEIGNSPALPVATDPDVGYPPGYPLISGFDPYTNLFPGFAYAFDPATVESARIRFTLNPWQVARGWCEMQTPYDIHSKDTAGTGGGGTGGAGGAPAWLLGAIPMGGSAGEGYVPPGYLAGPDSGGFGLSRYRCVPPEHNGVMPTAGDPGKIMMCWNSLCWCDARSCAYYDPPSTVFATRVKLDAALDNSGASLVGTLKIGQGAQIAVTVRLKRVPH